MWVLGYKNLGLYSWLNSCRKPDENAVNARVSILDTAIWYYDNGIKVGLQDDLLPCGTNLSNSSITRLHQKESHTYQISGSL